MITIHVTAEFADAARAAVRASEFSHIARVSRSERSVRHGFRTTREGLSFDARMRLADVVRNALPPHDIGLPVHAA